MYLEKGDILLDVIYTSVRFQLTRIMEMRLYLY